LRGFDEGEERIRQLSSYIREGAEAFLRRQYLVVSVFLLALFVILLLMSFGGFSAPGPVGIFDGRGVQWAGGLSGDEDRHGEQRAHDRGCQAEPQ
jgi:hypothetical protein